MYFSATIINDFIEYAASKGADVTSLRAEFSDIQDQKYISYDTIVKVLNYIIKALDDDYLGLHIGEQVSLKTTAYVDSIMQNSETLNKAFENATYYSRLISDALESSLVVTDHSYSVIFEENPNWGVHQSHAKRQILDLTLLSCLKSIIAYTKRKYYPVMIRFHTEKPKNLKEYYRLFNCSLKFNQPKTEIIFEKQIFDKHSKNIPLGLLENLKDKIATEIGSLGTENELIYQLKKSILEHKPQRISLAEAAKQLNLSGRTLQRKLKSLNTNFKEIEYELQLRLSKTYLEEKKKSIDEISYLLGFSESSAFIRFFKSLTKQTPTEYKGTLA